MKIPNILKTISKELLKSGAKAIVVGGSVRDHFLNQPIKDYDIEVYGLETIDRLEDILKEYGSVNLVGKSFGVLKFRYKREEYDFSFPRVEKKVSKGHRGFDITCSGDMSFKEASLRRDFTINAMGYDIEENRFLDPYGGLDDIKKGILRAVNSSTFREDPLRVYRAIQFSARFEYRLSKNTTKTCKEMVKDNLLDELAKERVYIEFQKLLLKSKKPSIGFKLIKELGVIKKYPELEIISKRDSWIYTLLAIDKIANILDKKDKNSLKLIFSTLCQNFIKISHTKSFLERLTNEQKFIESVILLVEHRQIAKRYYIEKAKDYSIKKLSTKINIEELIKVEMANSLDNYIAIDWLKNRAKELGVYNRPPKPILKGRDLISIGIKPSKEFKDILNRVYEAQLKGEIEEYNKAILFVKSIVKK